METRSEISTEADGESDHEHDLVLNATALTSDLRVSLQPVRVALVDRPVDSEMVKRCLSMVLI